MIRQRYKSKHAFIKHETKINMFGDLSLEMDIFKLSRAHLLFKKKIKIRQKTQSRRARRPVAKTALVVIYKKHTPQNTKSKLNHCVRFFFLECVSQSQKFHST